MEIGDRLKEIRKTLKLTQAEFGEKMGLKPTAIGQMESGARNVTDRTLILLEEKHNVNSDYLLYGEGEMFVQPNTFSLDEYAKTNGLTERDRVIIREFMALDPGAKDAVYNMLEKVFFSEEWHGNKQIDYYNEITRDPDEFEKEFPPINPEESKVI
jgi:transcriptional regulator with XRE-family HTH domain